MRVEICRSSVALTLKENGAGMFPREVEKRLGETTQIVVVIDTDRSDNEYLGLRVMCYEKQEVLYEMTDDPVERRKQAKCWCQRVAGNRATVPCFCKSHKLITLYDDLGYMIGKTSVFTSLCQRYPIYRDTLQQVQLSRTDLEKHIHRLPGYYRSIEVELRCHSNDVVNVDNNSNTNLANVLGTTDQTFEVKNSVQVKLNKHQVAILMVNSEFFYTIIQKFCTGKDVVKLGDVDEGVFRRLVDLLQFGQSVYISTEGGPTLQECGRDMLMLTDRFMIPDLAEVCAKAVITAATESTALDDMKMLITHYKGDNKAEILAEMGKILDWQQDDVRATMQDLCTTLPDVAATMFRKLFTEGVQTKGIKQFQLSL